MSDFLRNLFFLIVPFFRPWMNFRKSEILPNGYFEYLKFRLNLSKIYWPKDKTCMVANPRKIYVGKCSKIGRPFSYLQGGGGIFIGDYVRFGPGVGILTSNHDFYNRDKNNVKPIKIGDYCWIGMHAMVLSGVELGPCTIVGAGSVVTKSFPEGYCVIAGNPAKVIRFLDKNKVQMPSHPEYYGYIPASKFEKVRKKYIDV